MLGAIIGDIAGSRFEFRNTKSKNFEFINDYCDFTDDSVLTVAVAKTLLDCGHGATEQTIFDRAVINIQGFARLYPHRGYGGHFRAWIKSDKPQPYNSCGNGAGMRISPVGLFAKTEDELKLYSRAVTETTHNHPEGVKAAEAVTTAIFLAKNGATKEEIKDRIAKDYYPEIATETCTYEFMHENYDWGYGGNGGLAQYSTPQAIACFLIAENYEDAIRTAVSIGGDSDTIAAMTGGIAEAYYGIPKNLENLAYEYISHEFKKILTDFRKAIANADE